MKRILIIGAPNSQHTINFIDTILLSRKELFDEIILFSIEYQTEVRDCFEDYYRNNNIKLVQCNKVSVAGLRKIRAILNLFRTTRELNRLIKVNNMFDYCFILYCSLQGAFWASKYAKHFSRIIPVFFGSDILRNKRINNHYYQKMLAHSYKVILPNIHTGEVFSKKTRGRFDAKKNVIQYPNNMVNIMLDLETSIDEFDIRKKFGLPQNKIVVLCGHTATRAEQYEEMIKSLKKCNTTTRDECFFVFMMTTSPVECCTYQLEVERLLSDGVIKGVIFKKYINYLDMAKLHYASDIHVTTIKTDAFSCFLQEELISGSILIYGKWLNYYEIENGEFYAFSIDTIADLTRTLDDIVKDYEINVEKSKVNRTGILKLASRYSIQSEWNKYVFND